MKRSAVEKLMSVNNEFLVD